MRARNAAINIAFWLIVAASVLLASVVLLAKIGLPLANAYQPQIERNLTQLTGMNVRVGEVYGELNGVDVALRGSGIHVDTANQKSALSIQHLVMELDLPRTLLTLSPQFKNVSVSGVRLLLQEDGAGEVTLRGLAESTKNSGGDAVAISRILNYAADQQQMSVTEVDVQIASPRFESLDIAVPAAYLIKQFSKTLVSADAFVGGVKDPVQVRAQISTDLTNFLQQQVVAYVKVPRITLPLDWLANDSLKKVDSISFAGDYWMTYQPTKGVSVQAQNSEFELAFVDQSPLQGVADWKLKYTPDDVHATIEGLDLTVGEHAYQGVNINAEWESQSRRAFVVFNKMDAQIATRTALNFVPEDWRLYDMLTALEPRGEASNASLRIWHEDQTVRYQYLSNVLDAQVSSYDGIPSANHVDGLFSLSDSEGSIEFRAHKGLVAFPTIYDDAWEISRASGKVSWLRQDRAFVVTGRSLQIERNGATIQGGFHLEQPLEDGVGEDWLALNINAQHVQDADRFTFVPPNALSDSLQTWLDNALGAGEVDNVDVLIRTGLKKGDQPHVRLAIDATLDRVSFDPDWPAAESVQGQVFIDNDQVNVNLIKGVFAGLPVQNVDVVVPLSGAHSGWVDITGTMSGEANVILEALKQTPLRESVLEPFVDWQVAGAVAGGFAVSVPIEASSKDPEVVIDLTFNDNDVYVSQIDLPANIAIGALHYDSQQGLYDTFFNLTALGGESKVALRSADASDSEEMVIEGAIEGSIDSAELASWQHAPLAVKTRLQGKTTYKATLGIGRKQPGQVDFDVSSDLQGVSFSMPLPLAKRSDELRPTSVAITVLQDEMLLNVSSANWLYGKFLMADGALQGGNVSAFRALDDQLEIKKGIAFFGQFTQLDWQPWAPIVSDFTAVESNTTDESRDAIQTLPSKMPDWVRSAEIIVDNLPINNNNELNNVKLLFTRSQDGHPLTVTSDELNAVLRQTKIGPELQVAYLNWRTQPESLDLAAQNSDTVDAELFQPGVIPSMALLINEVYIDNRPYGDWQGNVVNLGNDLRLENVSTQLPNGKFDGQVVWQGGKQQQVNLTINAKGENARELTKKFSPTPFLTSDNYDIDVALSWQDSLMAFDRETLNGTIKFNVRKGNFNQVDQLPPFLRLLGIFNVDALAKRLTFDFSDLYEPGMPFDRFTSSLAIKNGILTTTEPVKVISPTAEVTLEGTANIITETLDERLTATVPITSTLPVAGLLLATPQVAGLLYITDKLIGDQLSKVTSIQYKIEGDFNNPTVSPVRYSPIQ